MTTDFSSNTFEHDYIVRCLGNMLEDAKTAKARDQILDKCAVELTAFMNGQIRQAVKHARSGLQEGV